jgi:ABC-type lipoprotein export system ATPase subunit/bifunctional DNA-binding transcriptional regulator/antitoxin component of YhaV-PrlF toxin-antitoxin module
MLNNGKPPIIVCENLVKIYKVAELEVVALQGLDLIVERGEMLGIVGTSGSGKSTLMNTLGGLDRPSAGRVSVDGIDLLTLNEEGLNQYQRSKVGFVWQQTSRNLIPYLTAQENVELPMTMAWVNSRKAKREWAEELLSAVGLYDRRNHKLTQLSGGEQQRVAIAVSLANKPVLLLGDEPTGEVDSATAQTIMDTFRALRDRLDLTIIIVTHDPRIAEQVDRVVAIRDGKISTETIRQVSQLEEALSGGKHATDADLTGQIHLGGADGPREQITLHEFVVLDSAGRLQIPKELREQLGIGKRAQLEMGDNCIVIRPVENQGDEGPKTLTLEEQIAMLFSEQQQMQAATAAGDKAAPEGKRRWSLRRALRK